MSTLKTLIVVAANDARAVRGAEFFAEHNNALPNMGGPEFDNYEETIQTAQVIGDLKRFNAARMSFAILPTSPGVAETAKGIRSGDTVRVSGNRYQVTKVLHSGQKEDMVSFLKDMDIYQLNELEIEKQLLANNR